MIKAVASVKVYMSKQKRYKSEIFRLSDDINNLRLLSSRLLNLVGQPSDSVKYDLDAIVDVAENRFMEVEDRVKSNVVLRVEKLEIATGTLTKDINFFKTNIGTDVSTQIKKLEASVKSFELSTKMSLSADVGEMRRLLINKIIPAVRDMWSLYMLTGSAEPAGDHLFSRFSTLEGAGNTFGGASGVFGPMLVQRIETLENQAMLGGQQGGGGMPSLFGTNFDTMAGGGNVAAPGPQGNSAAVTDLSYRLGGLVAKVKEMESQLGNATVNCGGQTFRSIDDCKTFIIQHVPG
jgi:hypothetical protein